MDVQIPGAVELVLALVIGALMLLFGRRLFWLMGGLALATIGLSVALVVILLIVVARYPTLMQALTDAVQSAQTTQSSTLQFPAGIPASLMDEVGRAFEDALAQFGALILLVGLVGAVAGSLILIRLPRLASAAVGFVGGIYLLQLAFTLYSVNLPGLLDTLLILGVGVAAAIAAWRNPDTSLIVFSTVLGAQILVTSLKFDLNTSFSAIVWLGLMLLGIIYQTGALRRRQAKARRAVIKPDPAIG